MYMLVAPLLLQSLSIPLEEKFNQRYRGMQAYSDKMTA